MHEDVKLKLIFHEKGMVGSVSDDVSGTSTVQYLDRKTNPNVRVMASDGNFMVCNGLDLSEGRYFSQLEQNEARAVCVLGADVASSLFPQGDGIGKTIRMAAKPYRVVGITQAKGSSSTRRVILGLDTSRSVIRPAQADFLPVERGAGLLALLHVAYQAYDLKASLLLYSEFEHTLAVSGR